MKNIFSLTSWKFVSIMALTALSAPAFATFQPVPEPSTLLLLSGGVAVSLLIGKFKGRK